MDTNFFPFLLVIFASIFQGSFGVGMKYMAPLKWESWWLVHVTVAMMLLPLIWALIAVPGLFEIIGAAPESSIYLAMLFGFLWGIGGIMFGVSVPYIGISLTYGIVMGLASSVGSLIPLFQIENEPGHTTSCNGPSSTRQFRESLYTRYDPDAGRRQCCRATALAFPSLSEAATCHSSPLPDPTFHTYTRSGQQSFVLEATTLCPSTGRPD